MTYDILKDYEDVERIPIGDGKEFREKTLLSLKAGQTFIPAETHYPQNKVDALVASGTIKLRTKLAPHGDAPVEPNAKAPGV